MSNMQCRPVSSCCNMLPCLSKKNWAVYDFDYLLCYLKDSDLVREYNLKDHVIFVMNTSSDDVSHGVGLRNFMMPLRASSIQSVDLKAVVFYVNLQCIQSEWASIACFPRVFVFPVSKPNLWNILMCFNKIQERFVGPTPRFKPKTAHLPSV